MATKKCTNGHLYDASIYGDKCPFCPSDSETVNINIPSEDGRTKVINDGPVDNPTRPTVPINNDDTPGGGTVIRHIGNNTGETGVGSNRRLVGLLVSYSVVPTGEVYKVFEGRTTIGRDRTCDLPFPNDSHMSSKHLLIQYVEAKGAFKAKDQGSSNGSYVNGQVYVLDETVDLKDHDVIVIGGTKFIFLAIPNL